MCGGLWASVIYSISLLEYRSLSAGRHWRISREYGGLSRRIAMDSTVAEQWRTVPHSGPTVQPRIVCAEFFKLGLCPSQCPHETILMALCLMVWHWRVFSAEPMLSCWTNLLFFCILYYFLFFFLPRAGCVGLWSSD